MLAEKFEHLKIFNIKANRRASATIPRFEAAFQFCENLRIRKFCKIAEFVVIRLEKFREGLLNDAC